MIKNKKIFAFVGLTCAALIIAAVLVVYLVSGADNLKDGTMRINVYYLNKSQNKLEAESKVIVIGEKEEMVRDVLNALMSEPKSGALARSVPNDENLIKRVEFKPEEVLAVITFSENYNTMAAADAIFCKAALVWTLTELPFIDNVLFYVEQDEMLKSNGRSMGYLNRENVIINPDIPLEKVNTQRVTLYFSDTQGMGLIAVERYIQVNPDRRMEMYVIEELLKGSDSEQLLNLIPLETKLISAKTEETICIVDLSKDFLDKHAGGSSSVKLTIYSIVNSLCELSNVKRVQFLIEGQKIQDFKGMFDMIKPIEADLSCVLTVEED